MERDNDKALSPGGVSMPSKLSWVMAAIFSILMVGTTVCQSWGPRPGHTDLQIQAGITIRVKHPVMFESGPAAGSLVYFSDTFREHRLEQITMW